MIISFKLPVCIRRSPDGSLVVKESKSLVYPTIFKIREQVSMDFKWIGWPGIVPETQAEKQQIEKMLQAVKCYPVWLEQQELEDFILFYEQFLRPVFHNFKGTSEKDVD